MADPERRIRKLQSILDVAKAMTAERDLDRLLDLILREAAEVVEADRCTLFLVDREKGELWSKIAQGTGQIRIPLTAGIAGEVATRGAAVRIDDAYADARFNREVDQLTGYRTRTVLCVPMRSTAGEVVGVIQALNRAEGVFTAEDEELLMALGGPAASAVENAQLHGEIEKLFEGFVQAAVVAIESRDPTTAGHSGRVAELTVGLAGAVERAPPPAHRGISFRPDDMRQLRYAALLHDFGKVGVRERVLVKAEKLYPHERDLIRSRFDLIRARLELERAEARLAGRTAAGVEQQLQELDAHWALVVEANKPTVLDQDQSERLRQLAGLTWRDGGVEKPYLDERELALLSIPRGSLSEKERLEIESHVRHTFDFLTQIPWTRILRRVPEIARAHHEKLDGRGYPLGLRADQIPPESRMMTIADIFDALTASDRPYKRAMPAEKALDILSQDARKGMLDGELLGVFVGSGVWKLTARSP
ncbi:MAG TPA: HD domain-containing phosphohydrolase [Anaeromyxobacteraceae bacterium]|nr:HD domain-containing phosphohydrolase [Anaeromyxobacteraceae bacterium]